MLFPSPQAVPVQLKAAEAFPPKAHCWVEPEATARWELVGAAGTEANAPETSTARSMPNARARLVPTTILLRPDEVVMASVTKGSDSHGRKTLLQRGPGRFRRIWGLSDSPGGRMARLHHPGGVPGRRLPQTAWAGWIPL